MADLNIAKVECVVFFFFRKKNSIFFFQMLGWVEFNDKRRARMIADMLNNEPMGVGKKKKFYSAELWSMKYLSKFSWHDLTLKLGMREREREFCYEARMILQNVSIFL